MQSHQILGASRLPSGVDRHSTSSGSALGRALDHVLRRVTNENRSGRALALRLAP
jgi:hypothetical protein